jgi:hypothetical protein
MTMIWSRYRYSLVWLVIIGLALVLAVLFT